MYLLLCSTGNLSSNTNEPLTVQHNRITVCANHGTALVFLIPEIYKALTKHGHSIAVSQTKLNYNYLCLTKHQHYLTKNGTVRVNKNAHVSQQLMVSYRIVWIMVNCVIQILNGTTWINTACVNWFMAGGSRLV